jgi:hypothetical protein
MPLAQTLLRPSGTVARARSSLAQLGWRERAHGVGTGASAHDGAARGGATWVRYGGDLTGAQEAAEESTTGPHRRVDDGAAELVGVDGGVGRHGGSAATYEDTRRENAVARRTHRRARTRVIGSGQRRSAAHVARRSAAALSERGT